MILGSLRLSVLSAPVAVPVTLQDLVQVPAGRGQLDAELLPSSTDDATAKLVASLEASQRKHLALEERHLARSLRTPDRTPAPTIALER
jgi:hypothetical protein